MTSRRTDKRHQPGHGGTRADEARRIVARSGMALAVLTAPAMVGVTGALLRDGLVGTLLPRCGRGCPTAAANRPLSGGGTTLRRPPEAGLLRSAGRVGRTGKWLEAGTQPPRPPNEP